MKQDDPRALALELSRLLSGFGFSIHSDSLFAMEFWKLS